MVALIALIFGLTEAGRGLGMNASSALFFLRYGVDRLPWMYIGLGILTFLATLAYAAALARFSWDFLRSFYLIVAALLIIERLLVPFDFPAIYPALWLTVYVIAWVLFMTAWSVAGQVFDTRQAKRLFSIFASASIIGGVVGNAVTGPLAERLGTENLYYIYAGLLTLDFVVVGRIISSLAPAQARESEKRRPIDDLLTGVRYIRRSRLMRLIAAVSVLMSILLFAVAFPFSQEVSASFPNEAAVASFFGSFTSVVMLSTFLVSFFLATRLYEWLGIVNVIIIVPLIYVAGFGLWTVHFTLITAAVLRYANLVWINGAGNTAWNALFNVFHSEKRAQLRAFESGGPAQLGISLAGVLLLVAERILTNQQLFVFGATAALICAGLAWRMREAYGSALLEAIQSGFVDVFTETPGGLARLRTDAQARRIALEALTDPRPTRRKVAAEVLGRMGMEQAVEPLIRCLDDEDPQVREAAIEALGAINDDAAIPAIQARVNDPHDGVRRRAVKALCDMRAPPDEWVERAVEDRDPWVRAAAGAFLHQVNGDERGLSLLLECVRTGDEQAKLAGLKVALSEGLKLPIEVLQERLEDESPNVRETAVRALTAHPTSAVETAVLEAIGDPDGRVRKAASEAAKVLEIDDRMLMERLRSGPPEVQRAALHALDADDPETRDALVEWTVGQLPELGEVRSVVASLDGRGGEKRSAAEAFLRDLIDRRRQALTELILESLSVLGGDETMEIVARGLRSQEGEIRAQALEALETLGDPRIVNGFMPLIEDEPDGEELPDRSNVIQDLRHDEDPWVRALTIYVEVKEGNGDPSALDSTVESESAPLVRRVWREATEPAGGDMTETVDTLPMMEKILCLRQVPAFRELDPDDLHQVAQIAQESWIPEGDFLCREGDIDDELFVIVSGEVSVTKLDEAGEEKFIRTLGEGAHVGELAIICRQPRSASVQAHSGDVQVLKISGETFDAILRDRPEVSRAMLASLARRLSTQV